MKLSLKTIMICMAAFSMAYPQTNHAQTTDDQMAQSQASERERLANQRIQADAEIRAQAERERLEAAEQERLRAELEAMKIEQANAPNRELEPSEPSESGGSVDLTRTLEQLRSLGELKDDGYITEEEFRKIKKKILDDRI